MKQADGLRRIELPNPNTNREHVCYRNQLQPEYEFEPEELKSVYQRHEAELLATAEQEAWDYLAGLRSVGLGAGGRFSMRGGNDGGMVCGAGRVKNPEESHLWLHLYALFRTLPAPTVRLPVDDYLGMDYTFYYDPETDTFEFDGFNTDAI